MEDAGIDIVTDGEIRRERYGARFALSLDGIDSDNPGRGASRPWFLRSITKRSAKITRPGPFTMTRQLKDDHIPKPVNAAQLLRKIEEWTFARDVGVRASA